MSFAYSGSHKTIISQNKFEHSENMNVKNFKISLVYATSGSIQPKFTLERWPIQEKLNCNMQSAEFKAPFRKAAKHATACKVAAALGPVEHF